MSHPFLGKRSSFSGFSGLELKAQPGPSDYYRDEEEQLDSNAVNNHGNHGNNYSSGGMFAANHQESVPTGIPGLSQGQSHGYMKGHSNVNSNVNANVNATTSTGIDTNTSTNYMASYNYLPRRAAYFQSHWQLYATDWADSKIAVGTFSEDQSNKIQIVEAVQQTEYQQTEYQGPKGSLDLNHVSDTPIAYPATKIRWGPSFSGLSSRLISTGDCLKLWEYTADNKLQQRSSLLNKSKSSFMPPLTSFDWNKTDPSLVVTSSIDTTCTIWNIDTSTAVTQLIAHDSEVYDVAFVANSVHIFASVGADGSVRVFDLRSLDHSTIIYEPPNPEPLLRVAPSPHDKHIIATIAQSSKTISVLDIRSPGVPLAVLEGHFKSVNAISWAPVSVKLPAQTLQDGTIPMSTRHLLASGGDDYNVNIWNLSGATSEGSSRSVSKSVGPQSGANAKVASSPANYSPVYTYSDSSEINNIAWSPDGTWMAVVSGRGIQGVKL